MNNHVTDSWHPERLAKKLPYLQARARIFSAVRDFFNRRDYLEVDTPALQASPCMEPHLQAFRTDTFYLHTSPEFAMKKLLVAGLPKIYQLAKVFRHEAPSRLHSPDFTLLEWYQTGMDYRAMMQETIELIRAVAQNPIVFDGKNCDPHQPWEILTVVEALKKYAGVDIENNLGDLAHIQSEAARIGVYLSPQDDWENALLKIIMDKVEPRIGSPVPTILTDYPVSMAALARPKPEDPRFAERFEVYICSIELANAFGELADAKIQRERFLHDISLRKKLYGADYPVDEDFLQALAFGLKPCSGNALGMDRLVMLVTGANDIDLVQALPVLPDKNPGWTVLHYLAAAEAQGLEVKSMVEMVLSAGADPHQADQKGDTAFNIAAPASPLTGRLMTLDWLSGKGTKGLNERSGAHGSTLAQYIAKWSLDDEIEEQIKSGLARGMTIDVPNSSGWTPLTAAAAMGRVKAVEVLLKFYDGTALHVLTRETYSTLYNGCPVTYLNGLDAIGVAKARLNQDRTLSPDVRRGLETCIALMEK
ncbi:MAG: EF-P lysine aminoacylase GenX [Proteobacteria bacterium]|nr:EF-P lysine aminoacylase GenX [Pseudomonadota bacterium]